jgi:hypothetical protein
MNEWLGSKRLAVFALAGVILVSGIWLASTFDDYTTPGPMIRATQGDLNSYECINGDGLSRYVACYGSPGVQGPPIMHSRASLRTGIYA